MEGGGEQKGNVMFLQLSLLLLLLPPPLLSLGSKKEEL